ncbi:MAG: rhomboid family intramembrane serine protease [Verrucomicrobiae bacterium]|nr:rhomboid family intramembrane serine protease [Verrucomicrobiae bacterium]
MFPLHDTIPSRTTPLVTRALILVNGVVFFLELTMPEPVLEQVFYLFGVVPARYTHPQWAEWVGFPVDDYWPLITHQFLHAGWAHFLGNMWTLWIFGDNVEDRMGHVRLLIFYLLCGVAAGLVQMLSAPHSTLPSVGASGAISGVLGAYMLWFPHSRLVMFLPVFFLPMFFEMSALFYLGWWFLIQLLSGTLTLVAPTRGGGIAWWAHVGGFVAGALLCWLFRKRRRRSRKMQADEFAFEWIWGPPRY